MPPPPPFVVADLEDHADRLDHEHPADQQQQDLLPADHGQQSQQSAQRQRAGIAQEDLGRMAVEPEEPQRRRSCRRQDGHFAAAGDPREVQVLGQLGVAAGVGDERHRRGGDSRQPPARPSRPSVRFTAFDEPTITSTDQGMNQGPSERCSQPAAAGTEPVGQRGVMLVDQPGGGAGHEDLSEEFCPGGDAAAGARSLVRSSTAPTAASPTATSRAACRQRLVRSPKAARRREVRR